MIGALWTGISGLASHQTALDNESHNIANVNTVGFKSSRISFADQMYQDRIGKGSKVLDAEKMYTQGNLKVTGVSFDMALSGDGFFAVSNTRSSGTAETFYTRAGNFRMGDNGTLQDAAGNEVQGWAMSAIDTDNDVISTNPNTSMFTADYTKLISSKIIKYTGSVETITSKATDYTQTAKADNELVYTGYGLKSQSSKVADIEELIKDYSTWLQRLKDEPDGTSSTSTAQTTFIEFPDKASGALSKDGDQAYVYINGNKISQSWDTDYETTMQKLADRISSLPGFKAYTATNNFDGDATVGEVGDYVASTSAAALATGTLKIESIIPGKGFTISELAMTSGTTVTQGNAVDVNTAGTAVIIGSGIGALQSSKEALTEAITGKQRDVYTTTDLLTPDGVKDYSYQITIYDKVTKQNITIPPAPLAITNPADIDAFVTAINTDTAATDELADYVYAENVNGNLVIKTLNSNFDVEFSGSMLRTDVAATIDKNATYSGREGASAEFIEIITRIDQTASKGSQQLRLDTLGISDSAFGEFSVDSSGLLTMKQDGAEFAIGQVAIALFNNNRGLEPTGDNLLKKTTESGDPIYNVNNDKTAKIEGKTLELSTADLSESLVNLMVFQRAFEANAKSITTSDELLNTLINLKR